jgi:hypothetical protein
MCSDEQSPPVCWCHLCLTLDPKNMSGRLIARKCRLCRWSGISEIRPARAGPSLARPGACSDRTGTLIQVDSPLTRRRIRCRGRAPPPVGAPAPPLDERFMACFSNVISCRCDPGTLRSTTNSHQLAGIYKGSTNFVERDRLDTEQGGIVDVTWTRKRVEQLGGLQEEPPPPTEIGRRSGFSKNAVIGMPGEPQFGVSSDTEFVIGNSRKVRRRGSLACRAIGYGSLSAILFWTLPVQAANDVTDLWQHRLVPDHRIRSLRHLRRDGCGKMKRRANTI